MNTWWKIFKSWFRRHSPAAYGFEQPCPPGFFRPPGPNERRPWCGKSGRVAAFEEAGSTPRNTQRDPRLPGRLAKGRIGRFPDHRRGEGGRGPRSQASASLWTGSGAAWSRRSGPAGPHGARVLDLFQAQPVRTDHVHPGMADRGPEHLGRERDRAGAVRPSAARPPGPRAVEWQNASASTVAQTSVRSRMPVRGGAGRVSPPGPSTSPAAAGWCSPPRASCRSGEIMLAQQLEAAGLSPAPSGRAAGRARVRSCGESAPSRPGVTDPVDVATGQRGEPGVEARRSLPYRRRPTPDVLQQPPEPPVQQPLPLLFPGWSPGPHGQPGRGHGLPRQFTSRHR